MGKRLFRDRICGRRSTPLKVRIAVFVFLVVLLAAVLVTGFYLLLSAWTATS